MKRFPRFSKRVSFIKGLKVKILTNRGVKGTCIKRKVRSESVEITEPKLY